MWGKLSARYTQELEDLEWALDPSQNFKNYRDALAKTSSVRAWVWAEFTVGSDLTDSSRRHRRVKHQPFPSSVSW